MPITKSAKKALRQNKRRRERNLKTAKELKLRLKETRKLRAAGKAEEARGQLPALQKLLDKAARKGLIKKNAASRSKSRLARKLKAQ